MRKQFLLLMALCLAIGQSWAERIDVATARKVAEAVAAGGSSLRSVGELSLVYAAAPGQTGSALRSAAASGEADYFVFNAAGDGGFVIVAGDDRVRPVLGYSHLGTFDPDNLPENLRGWLAEYQRQIAWAENNAVEATPKIAAEWNRYLNGMMLRAVPVEPVLLKTAEWGQNEPYNLFVPYKDPTGTVATAMAIVMKYFEKPYEANPDTREEYDGKVTYEPYAWDQMLMSSYNEEGVNPTQEQKEAVALLMRHCGANMHMKYNNDNSVSLVDMANALRDVFGYPWVRIVYSNGRTMEEWEGLVLEELIDGRPVVYSANRMNEKHTFVIDGFDENGSFHVNWGWDGNANGYYPLYYLDPDQTGNIYHEHSMLIDIDPDEGEEWSNNLSLRLIQSVWGNVTMYYNPAVTIGYVYAYVQNESSKPFEGFLDLCIAEGEHAYRSIDEDCKQEIKLEPGEIKKVSFSFSTSHDQVKRGDKIAIKYSFLEHTRYYILNDGSEGIKWFLQTYEDGEIVEQISDDIDFSVQETEDGFAERYLGVGIDNVGRMIYESDKYTSLLFRIRLIDKEWADDLEMFYEDPGRGTYRLHFNEDGIAWFNGLLFPYFNYDFNLIIRPYKGGYLNYVIEAFTDNSAVGYTLLGQFSKTVPILGSVPVEVSPIKGPMSVENKFSVKIGGITDGLLKNQQADVKIRIAGEYISRQVTPEIEYVNGRYGPYAIQWGGVTNYTTDEGTFPSVVGHIGSYITLGPEDKTLDFTFKMNSTFEGQVIVELAAKEGSVLDIIPVSGGKADIDITYSEDCVITAPELLNVTSNIGEGLSVRNGDEAIISLTATIGYLLPEKITIRYGDTEFSSDNYRYILSDDRKTATLTILTVLSDLQIYVVAESENPESQAHKVVVD